MRHQDIEIPEPCHADWEAMRPEDKGRFCSSCNKKVHDLSAMTKQEAAGFLRSTGCKDVCVSFLHREDGTLVFQPPALVPSAVVPAARLRRPRSVASAVAGVGMAVALAACTPHGEAPVQRHAPEAEVFQSPSVVVPHTAQPYGAVPTSAPEPCDPPTTEPAEPPPTPEPHVRDKIRRTAGKPMVRVKGDVAFVDPDAL